MRELLVELVPWGVDTVIAVQAALGGGLDPLFRAITWLGGTPLYVVALSLALWYGDTTRGLRLALLLLFSVYVNLVLKELFAIPRPYLVSSAVQAKDVATGYAFPSGHAQGATVAWLGAALVYRQRWAAVVGDLVIPLVAFSRVYLGVHYPQDVIAGVVLGLTITTGSVLLAQPLSRTWRCLPALVRIALCVALPLAMAAATADPVAQAVAGAILGLALGSVLDSQGDDARRAPSSAARALRLVLGVTITGLAWALTCVVGRIVSPGAASPALLTACRYALVALAASAGASWVFRRLSLSGPPLSGQD